MAPPPTPQSVCGQSTALAGSFTTEVVVLHITAATETCWDLPNVLELGVQRRSEAGAQLGAVRIAAAAAALTGPARHTALRHSRTTAGYYLIF